MGRGKYGGWQLQRDRRTGVYYVRFRHAGTRHNLSTGETDRVKAQKEAARRYAATVSGRVQTRGVKAPPLEEICAGWLADYAADHAPETCAEFERYCASYFLPAFGSLHGITSASCGDYARARLRSVKAGTVRKELSALRSLVTWCVDNGFLPEPVTVPSVPRRAVGTPSTKSPQVQVLLTPAQLEKLIRRLPETTRKPKGRPDAPPIPVRAAALVLAETGIRRATLWRLVAPDHYHRGAAELTITADVDKARAGRPLPLSTRARAALDSVCPDRGPIFGRVDLRYQLAEASKGLGLPPHQDGRVSYHDFRHSYLTHLAESGASLAAIQYLAGHKHASTSARYVHPGRRAAEEGLRALEAARSGTPTGTPRKADRRGRKRTG